MKYTTSTGDDFIVVFEALGGSSRATIDATRRSWPCYLAKLHEKHGCPVLLVVVCQDSGTARWAAEPISLGVASWPTYVVKPLVIGPESIPLPSGPITPDQLPMAVLSVVTHGQRGEVGPVLEHVADALKNTDKSTGASYAEVIWWALSPQSTAKRWMELMKAVNLDKEFLALLREGSIGAAVGQFEADAKARGQAEAIVRMLHKRRLVLTDEQREKVLSCTDLETLDRWFDAAFDATSVADVFG